MSDPDQYPHQQGDGEVTPEQLAEHFGEHPDMYHPALHQVVGKLLRENSGDQTIDGAAEGSTPEQVEAVAQVEACLAKKYDDHSELYKAVEIAQEAGITAGHPVFEGQKENALEIIISYLRSGHKSKDFIDFFNLPEEYGHALIDQLRPWAEALLKDRGGADFERVLKEQNRVIDCILSKKEELGISHDMLVQMWEFLSPLMEEEITTGRYKGTADRDYRRFGGTAGKNYANNPPEKKYSILRDLEKTLEIPKEQMKKYALNVLVLTAKEGHLAQLIDILTTFNLTNDDILQVDGLQEAVQEGTITVLKSNTVLKSKKKETFELIQELSAEQPIFFEWISSSPEVIAEMSKSIQLDLNAGNLDSAMQTKGLFPNAEEPQDVKLDGNLIKWITRIGDEEWVQSFPKTVSSAQEQISNILSQDLDLADYFMENLASYYQQPWVVDNLLKAVQHYSVAHKFIHAAEDVQTVWKDETWVVNVLSKSNAVVEEQQKQWDQEQETDEYGYSHGFEGFSETDPYENHPGRFSGQQIHMTSAVLDLMGGHSNPKKLQELGINAQEIGPILVDVNERINTAYQHFLEQISANPNIKDDDKQALLNPESGSVKMTPLLDNVRAFVARYLVQSDGGVPRLSEVGNLSDGFDQILAEGFRRYIKIHEVDVPLYDKLYEEFDNLRETGRYPLEVFLGRDGIYAYIGRHAQDIARRRKLGPEGRKELRDMGEVLEIHPQYTVYPRYFRDNLNYETKRQFLEQEGISPDNDPLFYDTGYTGTIPEQIMRVMDFDDEDIERRIRLLSAPHIHRRVKGIPENARSEIIEYIEHNAKTERAAEGLIIDKKTGKIQHIAEPTSPEEQYYFAMVKQAVARHYWLQEQLHHEPSGNINLDSEHYTIRIRQDYAKLLPQQFLHDPKEFFAQHGELLKGSNGEGEYPDEEITLFKLSDGTEIIAKKVELKKSKEARKEFTILIAAKKAGLSTAEPVGFLSGKEDDDGSYLLMKKVEGRSGRKFEKELRESGKYTDQQVREFMQQVAEKNRQMAELFRATLKIDKRWRIKDTIIEFNEETDEIGSVIPIDWERVENYDPDNPKTIDEIA